MTAVELRARELVMEETVEHYHPTFSDDESDELSDERWYHLGLRVRETEKAFVCAIADTFADIASLKRYDCDEYSGSQFEHADGSCLRVDQVFPLIGVPL